MLFLYSQEYFGICYINKCMCENKFHFAVKLVTTQVVLFFRFMFM